TALIRGSLIGRDSRARLFANTQWPTGPTTDLAIGSVTVLGRVEDADILGGYAPAGGGGPAPANGAAQIGKVVVGGDWVASNLAAGVDLATGQVIPGGSPGITARIASIAIGGQLIGTAAGGDAFVITAQEVDSIMVGSVSLGPLAAGPGNDHL